ncbi:glycosyltransferase family 39 protein [Hasllibacter sp. MH4015]|uniref:ArnT family glycosyltransferase n=1 Tax=Hasllibacter sp. MH4015 TaxID=2854029 RepID=UPI001CD7336F|nr:glycosyltransferase family 39 protein [Hasllibacter sp. MH4015]
MDILRHRFAPWAVFVLALASLFVGLAELPVQDRDEARFAQASRQMAETLDFIDIRLQDAPRHNKPALIYWLQSAAIFLTGSGQDSPIWVHRLPSYLAGALSALALIWAGTPVVGRRAAVLAGIICATIYMVHAEARTAKTDAALLLSVILAMGALAHAFLTSARKVSVAAIFWTALAAGFLLKGPMVAVPVLGALAWLWVRTRDLGWTRRLSPLPGLAWFALLVSPWFIAITILTEGAFWSASLGTDLSDKITAEGEHSGSPPGLYLLTMWWTFFPWSLFIPVALIHAWRTRATAETAILLGWLIPGWLVFEAVPVKLVHYTLPLYPALALLVAAALVRIHDGAERLGRWPLAVGLVPWGGALAFLSVVAIWGPVRFGDGLDIWATIGGVILCLSALAGAVFLWRREVVQALAALTLSGLTVGWTLTGAALPAATEFWISDRLAAATAAHGCLSGPVAIAGFGEPSAVFRLGTETLLTDAEGALAHLSQGPGRAAWIDPALVPGTPGGVADVTEVSGINIGNFSPVTLRLFLSPGVPAPADLCGG